MKQVKVRFRRPSLDEQTVLDQMTVREVRPEEIPRFNQYLEQEHYLKSAQLVGEHLRYVATWKGQWLAIASWSAPALHLKDRDAFIGWTEEQRRQRLALVVNNSRLWIFPQCHYPNLASRFMKLMLGRLSADWQRVWKHPVALAETFVDPQLYQGTAYKVSGWCHLGQTAGWKRDADDFYQKHNRPKQVWVRELVKKACVKLRSPQLPPDWAVVTAKVPPRCTAQVAQILSLMERLEQEVPEFRRPQSLAYPIAGMLALIAMALLSGVAKGYEDLAEYAATLSQAQLRVLGFRRDRQRGRYRCPKATCFQRVLAQVDAEAVERVLRLWQDQVLGPVQDRLVILDGKEIRHADVEVVNAVDGRGRWLGSVMVPAGTNEIPVARQQLSQLDLTGKIVLADAAHTQVETVQQILYEGGGDYLLTVKENQETLFQTVGTLLTPQRFSPGTHGPDPCHDPGVEPGPLRNPRVGLPGNHARAGGLPGSSHDCPVEASGASQGQEDHGDRLLDQQPEPGGIRCAGNAGT
jgi:hypothetical protein